jgi:hypothetical protein
MNEYKLTFSVTIKAQDDPAARKQAKDVLDNLKEVVPGTEAKLQEVYKDKQPRGIAFSK